MIATIVHIFDTVGPWPSTRFGLLVGAGVACALWAVLFYDPVFHLGFEATPADAAMGKEAHR